MAILNVASNEHKNDTIRDIYRYTYIDVKYL